MSSEADLTESELNQVKQSICPDCSEQLLIVSRREFLMKSSSDRIETLKVKAALISYFRFYKGHSIVCSEFNYGSADILSLDDNDNIYEVEVKVSVSDLKKEIGKSKHLNDQVSAVAKPCRFFCFAVPERMKDAAKEFCKTNFPYAGLYILRDGYFSSYGSTGINVSIIAKPLTLSLRGYRDIRERSIKGMANSLASVYSKLVDAEKKLLRIKMKL